MRISGVRVYRYDLPFTEALTLKGVTHHTREGLLLRLTGDDGSEGWGEAAPLPGFSHETLDEAADQLMELSEGMPVTRRSPSGNVQDILHPGTAPSVRFAVELAILSLNSAHRNVSMLDLFDPDASDSLPLNGLLSGPENEVLAGTRRMRDAGYRTVKLKVGRLPVQDEVKLVRDLGDLLGDDISLRFDANRAWSFEEAMEFAGGVRDIHIEYIEEPLADAALLPRFADESGLPVALDESLVGMEPGDLAKHGYVRAMVLKPTLLGGISRTLRLAKEARRLGMMAVVSSAYESGVGMLGLIPLAAATGGAPAGLDTYRRLSEDVVIPPLELLSPAVEIRPMLETRRTVGVDGLELLASL